MKKTLGFDCSTTGCSAAVVDASGVLAALSLDPPVAQAEALIPLIGRVLEQAGLDWSAIGLIGVTVGPGSFTGLRIGLAAARGLGLARAIPVIGVGTAEAFAHALPPEERSGRTVFVAIESRRADFFAQSFDAGLAPLTPLSTRLPEAALADVPGPVVVAGDAGPRLVEFADRHAASVSFAGSGPPDPVVVARLAAAHHAAGRGLPPVPLYLRPPDVTLRKGGA